MKNTARPRARSKARTRSLGDPRRTVRAPVGGWVGAILVVRPSRSAAPAESDRSGATARTGTRPGRPGARARPARSAASRSTRPGRPPAATPRRGRAGSSTSTSSPVSGSVTRTPFTTSPGIAATRLMARMSDSGSRNTTRDHVGASVGRSGPRAASHRARSTAHAALDDSNPPRTFWKRPRFGAASRPRKRYFFVAQKMSANSLTAASSWAAASASMFCLFLLASLRTFQTLVWRSGYAVRCSGLK